MSRHVSRKHGLDARLHVLGRQRALLLKLGQLDRLVGNSVLKVHHERVGALHRGAADHEFRVHLLHNLV